MWRGGARVKFTLRDCGPLGAPVNGDTLWTVLHIIYAADWPGYLHLRPTIQGVFPAVRVWRVQRAIRCFLRWRYEQRALAMAMGLHARLGQGCVFACLPSDVLALCVK